MITEAKEIFSDLEFFNNLFKDIKYEPTRAFFEERLFQNEEFNIEYFDKDKFVFEISDYVDGAYSFSFEIKNKEPNNYYPTEINLKYNEKKSQYQVEYVTYTNNNFTIFIGYADNQFEENKREIFFHHQTLIEYSSFNFIIKDNASSFENTKNIGNKFESYLNSLENPIEMITAIKRMFWLKNASIEQQDLDILKYDFKVENSIFSGYLNKASDIFMKNPTLNNKNNKKNVI